MTARSGPSRTLCGSPQGLLRAHEATSGLGLPTSLRRSVFDVWTLRAHCAVVIQISSLAPAKKPMRSHSSSRPCVSRATGVDAVNQKQQHESRIDALHSRLNQRQPACVRSQPRGGSRCDEHEHPEAASEDVVVRPQLMPGGSAHVMTREELEREC